MVMQKTKLYTYNADFVEDEQDPKGTKEFNDFIKQHNIKIQNRIEDGPGGGNPNADFVGTYDALVALIKGPLNSGDEEQEQDDISRIEPMT